MEDAENELSETKNEIYKLKQLFNKFKSQYADILNMQLNILDGDVIDIDLGADFMPNTSHEDIIHSGGLGEGGGYTGNNSFEHTNQDPAFGNRSSLNMDPFAAAQNSSGRFSTKHTQSYGKNSRKKPDTIDLKNTNRVNKQKSMPVENTTSTKSELQQEVQPEKKFTDTVKEQNNKMNVAANENLNNASVIKEAATTVDTRNESSTANTPNKSRTVNTPKEAPTVSNNTTNQGVIVGEVEDKIKESTMLKSEDNLDVRF